MVETPDDAALTIGDLVEQTGVSAATLRVWESRYGFPVPHRRASGHRRYDQRHVSTILDVLRRRAHGVRLGVAITQAQAADDQAGSVDEASVFARLRRTHPQLMPHRLGKTTLLALSHAIEDELCARSGQALVFGAFQRERQFRAAEARWHDIARTASSTYALADFAPESEPAGNVRLVSLPDGHAMLREWDVVCHAPDLPVALTAWELPGQRGVADADRRFEAIWTVDPSAVREATTVCARVAASAGTPGAEDLVTDLVRPAAPAAVDVAAVTALFNRFVAYVDAAR